MDSRDQQSASASDTVSSPSSLQNPNEPGFTVSVHSPKTVRTMTAVYTAYCLSFQSSSPSFRLNRTETRRRFSEFVWLRKQLNSIDNWRRPPSLPFKRFWSLLDPGFVDKRRQQLQSWLVTVLSEPLYMSSSALHLFLQTELTIRDIQDYLDGLISEDSIQEIWANNGKLYHYQSHNLLHNNIRQEPVEIAFTPEDLNLTKTAPSPSLLHHTPTFTPASLQSGHPAGDQTHPPSDQYAKTQRTQHLETDNVDRKEIVVSIEVHSENSSSAGRISSQNHQKEYAGQTRSTSKTESSKRAPLEPKQDNVQDVCEDTTRVSPTKTNQDSTSQEVERSPSDGESKLETNEKKTKKLDNQKLFVEPELGLGNKTQTEILNTKEKSNSVRDQNKQVINLSNTLKLKTKEGIIADGHKNQQEDDLPECIPQGSGRSVSRQVVHQTSDTSDETAAIKSKGRSPSPDSGFVDVQPLAGEVKRFVQSSQLPPRVSPFPAGQTHSINGD